MRQAFFSARNARPLALAVSLAVVAGCGGLSTETNNGGGVTDPRIVWRYPQAAAIASPAVDDSAVFYKAADNRVIAVNKRTGAFRWSSASTGAGQTTGHALLVAGAFVVSPDGAIFAFDRRTGAAAWTYSDGPSGGGGYTTLSTDSVRVFAGSVTGYAYAVDLATGNLAWKTLIATNTSQTNVYDPIVDAGLVVATFRRLEGPRGFTGGIVALNATTGSIVWQRELLPASPGLPSGGYGRAAFFGTLVIVSSADGRVYGLDRATGNNVWVYSQPAQADFSPLVVAGNTVVVAPVDESLFGLDASTGTFRWLVNPHHGSTASSMTVADGVVYVPFGTGQLGAVDPTAGQILWSTTRSDSLFFWKYPAIDATRVYGAAQNGLYSLRR